MLMSTIYTHQENKRGYWEYDVKISSAITDMRTCEYLAKMYTIYCNSRHSLFHVDALAPKIITQEEAICITDEILSLIEDFYS